MDVKQVGKKFIISGELAEVVRRAAEIKRLTPEQAIECALSNYHFDVVYAAISA